MKAEDTVRVAAIDCGTNSIRLLIADAQQPGNSKDANTPVPGLHDVVREMVITRLGQDVDRTGVLAPSAVERTLAVAEQYQEQIEALGASRARFVATSASRDAKNRATFVEGVRRITGLEPEVISGEEEAHLSFLGALSSVPSGLEGPYMVIDIGGGSTEFVLGDLAATSDGEKGDPQVLRSTSLDMGSVRVTERFGPEPWTAQRLAAARRWIDERLEGVDFAGVNTMVGVAGTVTSIAAFIAGVHQYTPSLTHGMIPTPEQWASSLQFMIEEPVEEKAALGFMPPGRADVIGGGALVLERILLRVGVLEEDEEGQILPGDNFLPVVVSEHDILDGLALSLAD